MVKIEGEVGLYMQDAQDFIDLTWVAIALLESVYEYKAILRQKE